MYTFENIKLVHVHIFSLHLKITNYLTGFGPKPKKKKQKLWSPL